MTAMTLKKPSSMALLPLMVLLLLLVSAVCPLAASLSGKTTAASKRGEGGWEKETQQHLDGDSDPYIRKEMIFITAPTEKNFTVIPAGIVNGRWNFGPVFNMPVLEEVFNLQQRIVSMVVAYTDPFNHSVYQFTLKDICVKPPGQSNCTILSVLNYFQNDWANLHYREDFGQIDYTQQIHYCTRDPTNAQGYFSEKHIPCLGAFGGPIEPNIVLNGYIRDKTGNYDYDTSIALVITLPVDTRGGKEQLVGAWEDAFSSTLATWVPQHISLSYTRK